MGKCKLSLSEPIAYRRFSDEGRLTPSLPVSIYRIGASSPLVFPAVLDTGSEFPLVVAPEIGAELMKLGKADGRDDIWVGKELSCNLFNVRVKLAGKWQTSRAYAPVNEDYDNIVGLPLLKDLNCCLRFPEARLHLADA